MGKLDWSNMNRKDIMEKGRRRTAKEKGAKESGKIEVR
jgi:hypothetical protein